MISPSLRSLPDNTQHSQQTNIHAPGGIRTHDLSRRAAADPRLKPHGHWDRQVNYMALFKETLSLGVLKIVWHFMCKLSPWEVCGEKCRTSCTRTLVLTFWCQNLTLGVMTCSRLYVKQGLHNKGHDRQSAAPIVWSSQHHATRWVNLTFSANGLK